MDIELFPGEISPFRGTLAIGVYCIGRNNWKVLGSV